MFLKISAIKNNTLVGNTSILSNQNTLSNGQLNQHGDSASRTNAAINSNVASRNLKTWRSDTNLHLYTNQASVPELDNEEDDDEVDDILGNNRQLEFSDHAGLYDILDNGQADPSGHHMDLEEEVEASLNNNGKLKMYRNNYKLTYDPFSAKKANNGNKKRDFFDLSNNVNPSGAVVNEDSLILNTSYNGLLVEQSDYDPNYDKGEFYVLIGNLN